MEQQKTLDWLKEVCEQALDEGRGGNHTLLTKIGNVPALSYYMNNVHMLHSITPEQYAEQAPGFVDAAEKYRAEYEAIAGITEDHSRLGEVEQELATIKGQLAEVLAELKKTSTPPAADPKKPAKKTADKVDEPAEGESEA